MAPRCACSRNRALEAVAVEQALHAQYLSEFGAMRKAEPSPDCLSYTSFLLATAYHEPWEVLMAARASLLLDLLGCRQRHRP